MKIKLVFAYVGIFLTTSAYADVGFTEKDVELVKSACLVGDSYQFSTKADGSISIKNLEGKGELSVSKKNVDTVDLPDADKREEFKEIRQCIKEYLKGKRDDGLSRTCQYKNGPKAGQTQYFPPSVPIIPAPIGTSCQDGMGSWGVAVKDAE